MSSSINPLTPQGSPACPRQYHIRFSAQAQAIAELTGLTNWADSDVEIVGDDEAQVATRFMLFQLLIAAPCDDEYVSIGAKTLSGFGYRGHVFWDTELFILPFFTLTQPQIARNLLLYRYHTLGGARRKAQERGHKGAQYPWESAMTGDEVTPRWVPALPGIPTASSRCASGRAIARFISRLMWPMRSGSTGGRRVTRCS